MNYSFIATFNINSRIITLDNTNLYNNSARIFVDMLVYAEAVKPCTKVLNIIDSASIEVNAFPIKSGQFTVIFSDMQPFKYQEICESLKDVQEIVNKNGQFIQINFRDETKLQRDKLNSIKSRLRNSGTINLKAHPVQFTPTQDQIEKAGFLEKQDCIVWLARKDFLDRSLDFSDIDELRDTVKIADETYSINDKNKVFVLGNDFLYYVLSLRKK